MELPYDGDTDDPRQYCAHGTFIGSWWGPDYLCFYCETGEEPPTQFQLDQQAFARRLREGRDDLRVFEQIVRNMSDKPYDARLAQALTDTALNNDYWAKAVWFFHRREIFAA